MKFTHIHSSSRYDRSPESLSRAFDSYVKQSTLVTFTEVEFERREKAVSAPHWKRIAGDESNRNDSLIAYDSRVFEEVHSEFFPIKGSTFVKYGKKRAEQLYATIAVLEDGLGSSFVIGVIHLPSSVEGDLAHNRQTERTKTWYSAVRQTRRRLKNLKRKFQSDAALMVADWNIDFKKPWARAVIKAVFPTWTLTWKDFGSGGTHGNRVIDGTVINGRFRIVEHASLMKDDDSSDHRPYKETLAI